MEKVVAAETPLTCTGAVDFEALVNAHARFVFKIAYAILRNAEDAEDVVQETFFRAYRSGEAARVTRMRAWLARIAWRLAVDRFRRRSRKQGRKESEHLLQFLPAGGPGVDESLLQGERLALVGHLLDGLPRALREALMLSTVEGMSSAQIAEVLDIPESSVRNRVSRARKHLKEKLAALMEDGHGA